MGTHIRVVVGRPSSIGGDDDDDDVAGPEVARLARSLRDAGMEVVLVAGGQMPEHLARIAVQQDAIARSPQELVDWIRDAVSEDSST